MDLKQITRLYKSTLSRVNEKKENALVLDSNQQAVILHTTSDNDRTNEIDAMLFNLMKALKLSHENCVVRFVGGDFSIRSIVYQDYIHIVAFGLSPERLGLQIHPTHHVVNHFLSSSLVFSYSLQELIEHPAKKRELWNSLKKQFEIS